MAIVLLLLPYRCLKVDLMQQTLCANFSLTTDYYIYGYTSYATFTYFIMFLRQFEPAVDFDYSCTRFAAYFFCNGVFPPCDFTSEAPRALCTESCHYLLTHCRTAYIQVKTFLKLIGYAISDNCENTLEPLQEYFGFPCSSSSLQNECIDLLGTYRVYVW